MRIIIILLGFLFFTTVNAGDFTLTSSSMTNNQRIPVLFTCDGKNQSPPLSWSNPPKDTVSYALELYSPDSVVGLYYNWIIYNIPPEMTSLNQGASENLPDNVLNAINTAGDYIYRGPCPPDTGLHHYNFELFALNSMLDLSGISDIDEITAMINRHKIKSTTLVVLFNH